MKKVLPVLIFVFAIVSVIMSYPRESRIKETANVDVGQDAFFPVKEEYGFDDDQQEGERREKSEEELLSDLKSKNPKVRWDAAANLGVMKSENGIEGLIKGLDDENRQVRLLSAWALGRIKNPRAADALINHLDEKNTDVVVFIILSIGYIGGEKGINALSDKLFKIQETGTRTAVIDSLRETRNPMAIPAMLKALKDPDENVRSSAARCLGYFKDDKQVVDALVTALDDKDPDVLVHSIIALEKLQAVECIPQIAPLKNHNNEEVRFQAARVINSLRNPLPREGSRLTDLQKEDKILEITAVPNLSIPDLRFMNPEDAPDLSLLPIKIGQKVNLEKESIRLKEAISPDVRSDAAWKLGNSGSPDAVEYLIAGMNDENSDVRWNVVKALGKLRDKRTLGPLMKALRDPDKDVREDAVEAIARLGDGKAQKEIINLVRNEEHAYIRAEAAMALAYMKGNVREKKQVLIEALYDSSPEVKVKACHSLCRLKAREALTHLTKLTKDENSDVANAAASAILGITGKRRCHSPDDERIEHFQR